MIIDIIPCLNDNYSYLICDEKTNNIIIVDPSEFSPCDKIISQKYKKLDYILNTHHHFDHVGGNNKLKKKYGSKILGFENDKERIPEIDIFLKNNQDFKIGDLNFKTLFIPGHTSGHIAFYLKKEKIIFTGDTLFSLGCGRIFEGTYQQMFDSLNKIKDLPEDTKIYCGHEYTLQNSNFCITHDPQNLNLQNKITKIKKKLNDNKPTIPTILKDEKECNIFLRAKNVESFSKLRDLKDNF